MPDAPNASPSARERGRPGSGAEGAPEQGRRLGLVSEVIDDESLLDTLADRLADRLAARLSAVESSPALLDAREVAQLTGKTRRWVYDHARELGAVPLGTGSRPRLGFPPDVIAQLKAAPRPAASTPALPLRVKPRRRRVSGAVSRTVAELLDGPRPVIGARARVGGQR